MRDAWRGQERTRSLEAVRLEKPKLCRNRISAQWDAAAARLKAYVEEGQAVGRRYLHCSSAPTTMVRSAKKVWTGRLEL